MNKSGYLVMTRMPGQSILIGDDIDVRVTGVHGDIVHFAITAPNAIPIDRTEVRTRKIANGEEITGSKTPGVGILRLFRRANQSLLIGQFEVSVSRISGNQVAIGVRAPRNISVDRSEVRARKIASPSEVRKAS